jgi:hypothetical protein
MIKEAVAYLSAAIAIVLSLASCGRDGGGAATGDVAAFTNVDVVPMTAETVLENQTVLVEGNRIVKIGPINEVNVPEDAAVAWPICTHTLKMTGWILIIGQCPHSLCSSPTV